MDDELLSVLRHMLGIDRRDVLNPVSYRDYYCANHDDAQLLALRDAGMVRMYRRDADYDWWTTTDAGKAAARASQRANVWPRQKRVYAAFLDVKDCRPDLTFREFLTLPEFAQSRAAVDSGRQR